ncbi:MAG TPA: FAD-binding protein, partial [Alphaproteobacteria bacterium]|nr:FAD-binding protein [Alphaproteobacteria bacterium]
MNAKEKIAGEEPAGTADLIIVGGGLVGLSLAIACAEGGIDTLAIEAEAPDTLTNPNYDGRTCAIAHGSQQ